MAKAKASGVTDPIWDEIYERRLERGWSLRDLADAAGSELQRDLARRARRDRAGVVHHPPVCIEALGYELTIRQVRRGS